MSEEVQQHDETPWQWFSKALLVGATVCVAGYFMGRKGPHRKRNGGNTTVRSRYPKGTTTLPEIMIARCPFCQKAVWLKDRNAPASLRAPFWWKQYSNGRDDMVTADSLCRHLFCVDGALNLRGHSPTEASRPGIREYPRSHSIVMAAEVPFVKPRLLHVPGMVAVVTDFPVDGGKYTAYPIVYFAPQSVGRTEEVFCIPWATKEYAIRASIACGFGTRSDTQEYALKPWIAHGKIYWLDKTQAHFPVVKTPAAHFPYPNVPGRRHPYTISRGRVSNLPQPKHGTPTFVWGD
jgi:hypothetical protein